MEGIYLGINITPSFCQAAWYENENKESRIIHFYPDLTNIPFVLAKVKGENQWIIGKEALELEKQGKAFLIKNVFSLLLKEELIIIEKNKYHPKDLVKIYFTRLLKKVLKFLKKDGVLRLTLTLNQTSAQIYDKLIQIIGELGIARESVQIINYTEAFLFFILNKNTQKQRGTSCMFELTNRGLDYYEFAMVRGRRPIPVIVTHHKLEQKFEIALLKRASVQKATDELLLEQAKKNMDKKLFANVFLKGESFKDTSWCKQFLNYLCRGRKVFVDENICVQGACANSYFFRNENTEKERYLCLCEGRLRSSISIDVFHQAKRFQLILAKAGSNWYEAKTSLDLLLEDGEDLQLKVETYGKRLGQTYTIPSINITERPKKTTRVELTLAFLEDDYLMVRIKDKGFGELFPATSLESKQYIRL